ncbi:MAG: tetratricopeptide repeat protein [Deltaproteobacteria bacterium]
MKGTGVTKAFHILIFIILGVMAAQAGVSDVMADTPEGLKALFDQGNRAYAQGNYDEALSCYKQIIERKGFSAPLLHNMGNAFYQKGDMGAAIAAYERALYLNPSNSAVKHNLRMARNRMGLPVDVPPAWEKGFDLLNINQWTWAAIGAFSLLGLIALLKGIRPHALKHRGVNGVSICLLLAFMLSGIGAWVQYQRVGEGVITGGDAAVMISPFDTAPKSKTLKTGSIVEMAKTYGGFIRVSDRSGSAGWVRKDAVTPIVPENLRS